MTTSSNERSDFTTILEAFDRFDAKMLDVQKALATLTARDDEHRRNVEAFWSRDWRPLVEKMEMHSTRVRNVESNVDKLAQSLSATMKLEEAVHDLVRWRDGLKGALAFAGLAGGLVAAAVDVAFRMMGR